MIKIIIIISILYFPFVLKSQSLQELMDSTTAYMSKQDFQSALQWALKAEEYAKSVFGENDTNYVSTLGSVSNIFFNLGMFDSTIHYGEINLKICRNLFKGDHPYLASNINNLAYFYYANGDYNKAEPLYKEDLEINSRIYKNDNLNLANSISYIANFYEGIGDYNHAESLYKEALEMRRRIFKNGQPDLANNISEMAHFYEVRGNYMQAELLYKESLEMFRRISKGDQPDLANCINNMAYFYEVQGDYKQAETMHIESLAMCRRIFKVYHPNLVYSINFLAKFYKGRGDYKQAEPLFKEAMAMCRQIFKSDHYDLSGSINNMAIFYKDKGDYKQAESLYKESLELTRRIFKGDHPYLAGSINSLAYFYYAKGDYNNAEPLFKESFEMRKRIFNGDHPNIANSITHWAHFYEGKGDYKIAETYYIEALEMYKRIFKNVHPYIALSINDMAVFYEGRADYKMAELLYLEQMSCYYSIMNSYFPSLTEREKEQYFSTFSKYYLQFNNFAVLRYKESPKILETMFDNQLLTKGMLLNSSNKVRSRILSSNDTNLISLYNDWKDRKEYIAMLFQLSKSQLEKKYINLDSIIKSANEQEKELTKRSEVFKKVYDKQKLSWQDAQKVLGKDEVIVEIARINLIEKKRTTDTIYYAALIIKKNSKEPEIVLFKNGNDLESIYINNYKKNILNKLEDKDSYTQFWEPISKKLKGIKRVFISPDGVYNQLNLATLMNPKTEHYLSDDIDIRVVTSTRDLVEKKMDSRITGNDTLLPIVEIFGDPLFNLDSKKHLELAISIAENRTSEFYYLGNTLDSTTRGGIKSLPSTRTEVETIAKEFTQKRWKVNSHLGEKALEEAVKEVNNPKVLHIATHGKFLKDVEVKNEDRILGMETKRVAENPLLRSFLLFSGAENTLNDQKLDNRNIDDGLLTAYEAMNLNLDKTELVVLSACETGLGEIKNGEGVYGLQRAFQQAGAKSIIMSLWSVPDKETQELMTSFYSKWLNGKDKRTAFNEARNEMRDKYHYPYYWGGFVMIGE